MDAGTPKSRRDSKAVSKECYNAISASSSELNENYSITLDVEVDVETSTLDPRDATELEIPTLSHQKRSTADALQQICKRFRHTKKDQSTNGAGSGRERLPMKGNAISNGVLLIEDKKFSGMQSDDSLSELSTSETNLAKASAENDDKERQLDEISEGEFLGAGILSSFHCHSQILNGARVTCRKTKSPKGKELFLSETYSLNHQLDSSPNSAEHRTFDKNESRGDRFTLPPYSKNSTGKCGVFKRRKKMFLRKYSAAYQASVESSHSAKGGSNRWSKLQENCRKHLSNSKSYTTCEERAKIETSCSTEGLLSKTSFDFPMHVGRQLKVENGPLSRVTNQNETKGAKLLPSIFNVQTKGDKKHSLAKLSSEFELQDLHIVPEQENPQIYLPHEVTEITLASVPLKLSSSEPLLLKPGGEISHLKEVDGECVAIGEETNPNIGCQSSRETYLGSGCVEESPPPLEDSGDSRIQSSADEVPALSEVFGKMAKQDSVEKSNDASCDDTSGPVSNLEDYTSSISPKSVGSTTSNTADHLLSTGSKIPSLTSRLKDVFNLILQTNFKTEDTELPNLNGVISMNISENVTPFDNFDNGKQVEVYPIKEPKSENLSSAENRVIEEVDTACDERIYAGLEPTGFIEQKQPFSCADTAVMSRAVLGDDFSLAVSCEASLYKLPVTVTTSLSTDTAVMTGAVLCNDFSPGVLCEDSSNKLPVTVTTSLSTKKTSTVTCQSEKESSHAFSDESELFSLTSKPLSQSESDVTALIPDAEVEGAQPRTGATSTPLGDTMREEDDGCDFDPQMVAFDMGTPDQDSSSSGAFDNEAVLRRSARLRTKTSERTLKKQLSVEAIKLQSNDDTQNVPELNSAIPNHSTSERIFKDLSGKDLFKAKIHLAADVIDDCPVTFELLEENFYTISFKKSRARKEIRRMVCDCALDDNEEPCGDDCLNRLLMIECSSRCFFGDKCTNKRFQHCEYAPFEVFKTGFKGWGMRAASDIGIGELIMEYCGEVVDQCEFTRRSLAYSRSNHTHFYFMALSQNEIIDATYKGNSSRFINHSCDPNAETQKWTVNGRLRVGFFCVKHIRKGEEITFDYQFERYGKVAQKCYCGTVKCRGYLGKAPDEDHESDEETAGLLSSEKLPSRRGDDAMKKEEKRKDKKFAVFGDDTMEEDLLKLSGGLCSSNEVLLLSRLMVKCETQAQRSSCLQVLKGTTSQTQLKAFLQFHGLSIIWSWMVDISGVDNSDAYALKLEIITALGMLPINNKNIIEDSKVLSVVQSWAKPETDEKPSAEGDAVKLREKGDENVADRQTENVSAKVEADDEEPTVTILPISDEVASKEGVLKDLSSDEELSNSKKCNTYASKKVLEAAASLLDSWKDLKEIYRIPKRQKPLSSPGRDTTNPRDDSASPQPKKSRAEDVVGKPDDTRGLRDSNHQSVHAGFDQNNRARSYRDLDIRFSSGSNNENRKELDRWKKFSTGSDDGSREGGLLPWHCRHLANSSKMSRLEHRRRFEKYMEKRAQERRRQERLGVDTAPANGHESIQKIRPPIGPRLKCIPVSVQPGGTTFTPSKFSGNLIQINPAEPVQQMSETPRFDVNTDQQRGHVSRVVAQKPSVVKVSRGQNFDVGGIHNQELDLQSAQRAGHAVSSVSMQDHQQPTTMRQQVTGNSANLAQPQTNDVTVLGSQYDQAVVLPSAEQFQKLHVKTDFSSSTKCLSSSTSDQKKRLKDKSSKNLVPKELPPNWKTATDPNGRIYYYHSLSRQTRWEPPTCDGNEEGVVTAKGTETDAATTLTYDEAWQKTSKDKNDGITNEGRKAKDTFRLKMSRFIVQCLDTYRKPDVRVGHIASTEDFKHLARKLTHNVMQKELKQVRVWEDLDFNTNVKHKAKDYVKIYMSRVGPVYRIRDDT